MQVLAQEVARALLSAGAITFTFDQPVTFKSGIQAPVYIDNRKLPYSPKCWRTVIVGFQQALQAQDTVFDVIAGIETAGIPHSAALSYTMRRPSVFVRKQTKDHGLQKRVEGGSVAGKRVILIEDQVTTGGSSLSGVEALRSEGAVVEDCFCITSYGFQEAIDSFTDAGVRLHTLTTFTIMADEATQAGLFAPEQLKVLHEWLNDPHGWNKNE
jgi:orotate phosphoribosyltransferase